eukprot:scaffold1395_cov152-Amphora_coffeaeformis.AAC.21
MLGGILGSSGSKHLQQEHVKLRRKRSNASTVKPTTLIFVLIGVILTLSGMATIQFASTLSNKKVGEYLHPTGIRKNGGPKAGAAAKSYVEIEKISSADDMERLLREYHKNPATGAAVTFAGTDACAAKVAQKEDSCRIFLPVDTSDDKRSIGDEPLLDGIALHTWKGRKEMVGMSANQDRSVMILFDGGTFGPSSLALLADGHGDAGHGVAEQVIADLPIRLLQAVEKAPNQLESTLRDIIKKCFLETDALTQEIEVDGGSTVVMILLLGETLYVASAGDSTGSVAAWDGTSATSVQLAVRHKPADSEEQKRIEAAGGEVVQPFGDPSSRVIIPSGKGPMFDTALAMSRCMGDKDGKDAGFLTAEPSVEVVNVKNYAGKELFVLLSSDGVTDMFPVGELIEGLGATLFDKNKAESLESVVEKALEIASSQWISKTGGYRDDMSLMVAKVTT